MPLILLGGLAVTTADGKPVALPTRKTALVLAVLALAGDKGATREALVEWIWPDRAEGQGKSSLRQALTAIRKALPAALPGAAIEGQDSLRLTAPEAGVDLPRFEALAGTDAPNEWCQAAALYAGDLLDGVALTEPLAGFVAAHRERLRRQALTLVEALSEADTAKPAVRTACEALANRLLAADPAAEPAHRALIRLRLAEGQPNAARRQLERCVEAVLRELGVGPEARTTALLEGDAPAVKAAPFPAPSPAPSPAAVVPAVQPARPRDQPSLVVMPFDDLGGSDDFFADGVVEEITAALSRIKDFFVIARQSAVAYKGRFVDVREVGRDLGVAYAVEGTVRRGGGRVRITVQLVDTETGRQLWSDRLEDASSGIFELQDRIASRVAGAINPSIRASEIERARRRAPENLQAYDLVLRALPHFWAHRKEDNEKALALFDEALAKDPDYGVALAFKAWCHAQQTTYIWTDDPVAERAKAIAAADRAALLVQDHTTALSAIGAAYSLCTPDQAHAMSFIDRALTLDPNNAWGWMRAGWLRTLNGQMTEAIACFERALALSPFDPFTFNIHFGMGLACAELGDFAKAIELVEKGLHSAPGVTWAYRMLASYHAQAGNQEKAAAALAELLRHNPGLTIEKLLRGMPPSLKASQPRYIEGLRKAGLPER